MITSISPRITSITRKNSIIHEITLINKSQQTIDNRLPSGWDHCPLSVVCCPFTSIRADTRDTLEANNQRTFHRGTFYADYFVYKNKSRTFASPEPPSLLTMLKSGVVFFI